MSTNKTIRVYGCGGAGVNIASRYIGVEPEVGCAQILPALVDTSQSNIRDRKTDDVYLVKNLDGSGKYRAENYEAIQKSVKQILVDIVPGEFNIVVFSAGGGSGSVIGPLLISELAERGIPAVAIVIGSYESAITTENTWKTLMSLDSMAQRVGVPLVMNYHANENAGKRSAVDKEIYSVIATLSILASGQNLEMDYRDLVHWVQFNKITKDQPCLASLHVVMDRSAFSGIVDPVSMASLYNSADQDHADLNCDYVSVGYTDLNAISVDEVHFVIALGHVSDIANDAKQRVAKMAEARDARVRPDSIVDQSVKSTDSGMIL